MIEHPVPRKTHHPSFEIQGHRGARGLFPENTIEGFLATIALGVDSLELDIAVTQDDVPVITHDPRLNQDLTRDAEGRWLDVTGPAIRDLTLAALAQYDVGRVNPSSALGARLPDQRGQDGLRIPTLAELFAATHSSAMIIDAELKTDPALPDLTVAPDVMADLVVAVAKRAGALHRLVIRSFDWRGLVHLQSSQPDLKLAWLSSGQTSPDPAITASRGTGTWAPHHADLSPVVVQAAQKSGLRVVPWTVNDPADMARLIGWGVDGLCTDRPDLARAVMRDLGLSLPSPFTAQPGT